MKLKTCSNLYILFCCTIFSKIAANELYFDTVEVVPLYFKDLYNISEVRISKFNHTTPVLNFRGEIFVDIDENFEVEVTYHYNRLNNNQYNKMPMIIKKSKVCAILDKYYTKFLMMDLKNCSNLPQFEPSEKFCPRKKVELFSLKFISK